MYHLSVKPLSRSAGRSATAASAYRAGEKVRDERTGETFDYTAKRGVEHAEIVLPAGSPSWATDREALWNAAEAAEKRKDARVAREYEVAIPKELDRAEAVELMRDFAAELVDRYGVAVDLAIHRDREVRWDGSEKGFKALHAHVLTSTRVLGGDGFGEKAHPELSDAKRKSLGLGDGAAEVERVRQLWEVVANRHLERAGYLQRIDCRSLKDQGIEREPTRHLGPAATELERRGERTDLGEVNRRIQAAHELGQEERRQAAALNRGILDLQTSLGEALRQRGELQRRALQENGKEQKQPPGTPVVVPAPKKVEPPAWPAPTRDQMLDVGLLGPLNIKGLSPAAVRDGYVFFARGYQQRRAAELDRVYERVEARMKRRDEQLLRHVNRRPEPPTGVLAVFKRKAYEQDWAAWGVEVQRRRELDRQARALGERIRTERLGHRTEAWSARLMQNKQPELFAAYTLLRREELVREQQQLEKQRLQQQERERSRDRDRGLEL